MEKSVVQRLMTKSANKRNCQVSESLVSTTTAHVTSPVTQKTCISPSNTINVTLKTCVSPSNFEFSTTSFKYVNVRVGLKKEFALISNTSRSTKNCNVGKLNLTLALRPP